MKNKIIILLLLTLLLSGCNFVTPDTNFIKLIIESDTPQKIGTYMWLNFVYEYQPYGVKTPYQLYLCKKGDCNDFSNFAIYVAHCNGYEAWQIRIKYRDSNINHWLGVYKEGDYYTYTDNRNYIVNHYDSFLDIVNIHCLVKGKTWEKYEVYDYENNFIEVGK